MFRSSKAAKLGRFKYGISFEGFSPYVVPPEAWANPYNTTYGISAGGRKTAGGYTNKFERSTYSTETNATNAATISAAQAMWGSCMSNGTKAFMCGGGQDSAGTRIATITAYTFGSDSATTSGATLSQGGREKCGAGVGTTIGYVTPGLLAAGTTQTTEKITMATETCVVGPTAATTINSDPRPRCGGNQIYLYLTGLDYTSKVIERIVFATNGISTLGAAMVNARHDATPRTNPDGTHVYFSSGGGGTSIEKLALSTETSATIAATVSPLVNAGHPAGSTTKFYTIGGYAATWSAAAYGLTYSSDTTGAVTGMNAIENATWAGGA